ncbi:MAG: DUF5806 family protein [Halobacteriaceae archaeon]
MSEDAGDGAAAPGDRPADGENETEERTPRTSDAGPASGEDPASDEAPVSDDGPEADDAPEADAGDGARSRDPDGRTDLPEDVRTYDRFTKMDGAQYERVNEFLRDRTHITAREWAIARLCADFRTETGVEMTKIGENLPYLVPFMTDEYSPQAVNQARAAFEQKVRKAGATFLYGAMCDFLTADELDDVMYEATEVAKFLLEVEGVDLSVEEELEAEERISSVMREVRASSDALRHEGVSCPHCGNEFTPEQAGDTSDDDDAGRGGEDRGTTADATENRVAGPTPDGGPD